MIMLGWCGGRLRLRLLIAVLGLLGAGSLALASRAEAFVYWSNSTTGSTVGRASLDGSGVNQNFIAGATGPLAVDGHHIYWATGNGNIGRANLDGSGANGSWVKANADGGIAVDRSYIYWSNWSSGTIGRANVDGTGVNSNFISTHQNGILRIAVDGSHIYWTNYYNGIGRANLDGTGVDNNFHRSNLAKGIAVDASHIYWSVDQSHAILRMNLDGSNAQALIGSVPDPSDIAVDASHIYYTDNRSSTGTTYDTIARANLDGSGVNDNFITGGGAKTGVAVDSLRPAAMHLECSPSGVLVGASSVCTATVSEPSTAPLTPVGGVTFSATGGTFNAKGGPAPTTSCALSGSGGSVSCQAVWTPPANALVGQGYTITGSYAGDGVHTPTSADTVVSVVGKGAPQLTDVTQSAAQWRLGNALPHTARVKAPVGTIFGFALDRAARVRFLFTHIVTGRRAGGKCVAQTDRNRNKARCLRTVGIAFSVRAHAGRTRLHFEGRLDRKRRLALGRYKLIITAAANGRRSRPATLHFTILR